MTRLHSYPQLLHQREELLKQKEWFYVKYFTKEDHVIWEIVTKEDYPKWDDIDMKLFHVNELIEKWERVAKKIKWLRFLFFM